MDEQHLPHDWFPRAIPENVVLGPRSWLYSSYALVHFRSAQPVGLRVGHDSGLYNGTFFDTGPDSVIEIGDYCAIVGAVFATNGSVTIRDYCFIAHEVVIADSGAAVPADSLQSVGPASHKIVEANVWIGARAILLGNIHVGEGAVIGAGALVTCDVPAYSVFAGNPGRVVAQVRRK